MFRATKNFASTVPNPNNAPRPRPRFPAFGSGDPRSQRAEPLAPLHDRDRLLVDIHRQLIDDYAPPSMMVDQDGKLIHLSPSMVRFVVPTARSPFAALEAVLPVLRAPLHDALLHARASGESVQARPVRMAGSNHPVLVNMVVRPLHPPQAGSQWMLVMFVEVEAAPVSGGEVSAEPLAEKESQEIHTARQELLCTLAESETSAEELRAANEDLQSLNEELHSATEELETTKEELQAVNEELTTVNRELKSKMDEAVKSNDDLKNLIEANDIATVFVDAELRIKRFTPRAAQVFNLIASDVGRPLPDITHKLAYDSLAQDARQAVVGQSPIEREVQSDDGRWFLVRLLPYRTLENCSEGAVLNFIDITGRHEAEERARHAGEVRMQLVAETTQDYAIITLDAGGLMTSWNRGAEQIFGYTEAEAVGQHGALIFTPADRVLGVPEDEMRRAREHGRALDERWHLRKDGSVFYCSGVMTALAALGGEGYAKIARDLTEAKRVQEQREMLLQSEQSLRAQLEAASRQKDEFLAVMSHELKNPLNLIALNAELLKRLPETRVVPSAVRIADTIRASVGSQAQIINDLLDLSRMQTGKLSLSRSLVSWDEVMQRIADAVQPDAAAGGLL